ncbi:MAG TPA: hypothetical protein VHN99_06530, partial [Deinococcales bacterium]|nr:hypothetical protein [Deinococcales bacterium]
DLSGRDFTARALHAKGRATTVLRLPEEAGRTRILASYPSEGTTVEITLDGKGRIVAETQTSPPRLVARTLAYPGAD